MYTMYTLRNTHLEKNIKKHFSLHDVVSSKSDHYVLFNTWFALSAPSVPLGPFGLGPIDPFARGTNVASTHLKHMRQWVTHQPDTMNIDDHDDQLNTSITPKGSK